MAVFVLVSGRKSLANVKALSKQSATLSEQSATLTNKKTALGGVISSNFVVQKDSLDQDVVISGTCTSTGGSRYQLSSSYLYKVCNYGCDPTDPDPLASLQFLNVQLQDNFRFLSSVSGSATLVKVDVVALDDYTRNQSVIDSSSCSNLPMGSGTNFSASCTLLVPQNSSLICPSAQQPPVPRFKDRMSSLFSNILGRERPNAEKALDKLPSFIGVQQLLPHSSMLGAPQCTVISSTSVCLVYKATFVYEFVVNNPNSCPVFDLTNVVQAVQANSTHCVCSEAKLLEKHGNLPGIVGQCGTNVSYCSIDSAVSKSPVITANQNFSLNCVVEEDCSDCGQTLGSNCSHSKVVCTARFENLGDAPLNLNEIIFTSSQTTELTLVPSINNSNCTFTQNGPNSILFGQCCISGRSNVEIVAEACIPKSDVNQVFTMSEQGTYANQCNPAAGSINITVPPTTFTVEAQKLCVSLTKEILSGPSVQCPSNATAPAPCANYLVNANVDCGCIFTNTFVRDFLVDDLSDIVSKGAVITNIVTSNPNLVCAFNAIDRKLHCNLNGAVSVDTLLQVKYSACFANCQATCRQPSLPPTIPLLNTVTLNYTSGINTLVTTASANAVLVCECDDCLCTINQKITLTETENVIRLDRFNGVAANSASTFFQGSQCNIINTDTGDTLGEFVYARTGGTTWDCVSIANSTSDCTCIDRYRLKCNKPLNATVSCCASNPQFPNGPIDGQVAIEVCGLNASSTVVSFFCLGESLAFTGPDPSFVGQKVPVDTAVSDFSLAKKKSFSCNPNFNFYNISYGTQESFRNVGSKNGTFTITDFVAMWTATTKPPQFTLPYEIYSFGTGKDWIIPNKNDYSTISCANVNPDEAAKALVFRYPSSPFSPSNAASGNELFTSITVLFTHATGQTLTQTFAGSAICN